MKLYKRKCRLMGSAFELGVVECEEARALWLLEAGVAEVQRIEQLLSEFIPSSVTSTLNRQAGQSPVVVDEESFYLLERCLNLSRLSKGYFDVSSSPLKKHYTFKQADFKLPDIKSIQNTLAAVGYDKIVLHPPTLSVVFKHPETRISFAAIGKGYAADRVKQLWQQLGVEGGYVNASGDLNAFGTKPDGTPWHIGIAHPDEPAKVLMYIPLNNAAVATSGDYQQFFLHNNIRYSHQINPNTGLPVCGIKSVTVISPSAELSDGLATALFVMGTKAGIHFANQLPKTHCIMIDEANQVHLTKQLNYETTIP